MHHVSPPRFGAWKRVGRKGFKDPPLAVLAHELVPQTVAVVFNAPMQPCQLQPVFGSESHVQDLVRTRARPCAFRGMQGHIADDIAFFFRHGMGDFVLACGVHSWAGSSSN